MSAPPGGASWTSAPPPPDDCLSVPLQPPASKVAAGALVALSGGTSFRMAASPAGLLVVADDAVGRPTGTFVAPDGTATPLGALSLPAPAGGVDPADPIRGLAAAGGPCGFLVTQVSSGGALWALAIGPKGAVAGRQAVDTGVTAASATVLADEGGFLIDTPSATYHALASGKLDGGALLHAPGAHAAVAGSGALLLLSAGTGDGALHVRVASPDLRSIGADRAWPLGLAGAGIAALAAAASDAGFLVAAATARGDGSAGPVLLELLDGQGTLDASAMTSAGGSGSGMEPGVGLASAGDHFLLGVPAAGAVALEDVEGGGAGGGALATTPVLSLAAGKGTPFAVAGAAGVAAVAASGASGGISVQLVKLQ